jgi:hypothetical protein
VRLVKQIAKRGAAVTYFQVLDRLQAQKKEHPSDEAPVKLPTSAFQARAPEPEC